MGTRLSLGVPIGYWPLHLSRHAQICGGHVHSLTGEHQDLQGKIWKDIIDIRLVLNDDIMVHGTYQFPPRNTGTGRPHIQCSACGGNDYFRKDCQKTLWH